MRPIWFSKFLDGIAVSMTIQTSKMKNDVKLFCAVFQIFGRNYKLQ